MLESNGPRGYGAHYKKGLVILLIKELMKYMSSIFVSHLFVYFSTLAHPQYFYSTHIIISIYFSCQTLCEKTRKTSSDKQER